MTNVVWLAAHAATPFEPERLLTWADAIQATLAARLAPLTRVEAWSRHTALVAWVDERQIPRTWRQTQSAGGRLAITDGFPIGFERAGLTNAAPLAIADALVRDRRAIEVFLPPFASVAADHGRVRDRHRRARVRQGLSSDVGRRHRLVGLADGAVVVRVWRGAPLGSRLDQPAGARGVHR